MTGRMSGCGQDRGNSVAEHVVVAMQEGRSGVGERAIGRGVLPLSEREGALRFLYEPYRRGVLVRVPHVIGVRVRDRKERDRRRLDPYLQELASERPPDAPARIFRRLPAACEPVAESGLPQERAIAIDDERARDGHVARLLRKPVRTEIAVGERTAVEDV